MAALFTEATAAYRRPKLSFMKYIMDQALMVTITDTQGIIIYANELFCRHCGYQRYELTGRPHQIIDGGFGDEKTLAQQQAQLRQGDYWRGEFCNYKKSGEPYWEDITIIPERNEQGKIIAFISIRFDITRQIALRDGLYQRSYYDSMTRLLNRIGFLERAEEIIQDSQRQSQPICLAILDVDNFKIINDSYGHAAGDSVLRRLAVRLGAAAGVLPGRLGGDEFVLLFPAGLAPEDPELSRLLNIILARVARPIRLKGQRQVMPAVSLGVACAPYHGLRLSVLLKHADQALYRIKNSGGNGYALFGSLNTARRFGRDGADSA
ncbi:sensor domain-containing diguanylate cyclase [Martelella alba]|uniref:Diguanylate cyclase n=1 Tax=Martelella alba TaxID=2590451 RepID=A0ABY2SIX0_9HYPH|nr:GGDEF domain-containing protein [Martelella alba]TKI04581.1 diguanylate cyclase [Martelella alba]